MEDKLWHKSYAPGVKKTLEYEKVTLSQALTRSAENFPNHTALNLSLIHISEPTRLDA